MDSVEALMPGEHTGPVEPGKVRFYLGGDHAGWLPRAGYPLFFCYRELRRRKAPLARAAAPWALDSGGFNELRRRGRWTTGPEEYADAAARYAADAGSLDFAAPQDSMCEPFILDRVEQETGRRPSVREHQELTTANYLRLGEIAPDVPWIPVVQGWEHDEYLAHVELYRTAGVDLTREPLVGVGSVCSRQDTAAAERIFVALHAQGLRLHGFGLKITGLGRFGWTLASADSMAWSLHARRAGRPLLSACTHRARTCAHCLDYATVWRDRVLARLAQDQQTSLAV